MELRRILGARLESWPKTAAVDMYRAMRWRGWLLFVVWLIGCERVPTAPLLELSSVTPKRVELGDELEIEGRGLPEGREARVVLRGTLYRPGESPEDAELETIGRVVSRDRILVPIGDELMGSLCGEGRGAVHTTFTGSVDVIFAAQRPGAPPVSGTVDGVELDATPQGVRRDEEEGVRALAAIGVHLATPAEEGSTGLAIASVDPGSRAQSAGIGAGDRLLSFANVRVLDPSDVALPPGRTSTTVRVTHGFQSDRERVADDEELTVSIDGVAPPARGRVTLGLALAALVAVAIFALIGPFARVLAWTERRLGEGLSPRSHTGRMSAAAPLLLACALVLPLGRSFFAARVDLALVTVTIQLAWLALALSSARGPKDAVSKVMDHSAQAIPVFAAIAVIGARDGALAAGDVLRAQGAEPWATTLARSPVGVLLLGLLLVPWLLPSSDNGGARARIPTILSCAVAATALLGGWRFFGVAPAQLAVLGLVAFLVKTGALYALVAWTRRSLPIVSTRAWVRVVWPLAAVTASLELICQRLAVPAIAGSITALAALALLTFVLLRARRISSGHSPRVHADALL